MIRRILLWAGVAFVIYYLTTDPNGAAHTVGTALGWAKSLAAAITTMLNHHGG